MLSKNNIKIVWDGKNDVVNDVVVPIICKEHINVNQPKEVNVLDTIVGCYDNWCNKLIFGDNKFILPSIKRGAIGNEIEKNGGIKLIYIDPPFDVGIDFNMGITVGDSVIDEVAYIDKWGKGTDSFITMIYERLKVMHDLLAEDGSIFVHCDWRVNSYIRLILDEIFGADNFRNEIIWKRDATGKGASRNSCQFPKEIEYIFWYTKSDNYTFTQPVKTSNELSVSQLNRKEWWYKIDIY